MYYYTKQIIDNLQNVNIQNKIELLEEKTCGVRSQIVIKTNPRMYIAYPPHEGRENMEMDDKFVAEVAFKQQSYSENRPHLFKLGDRIDTLTTTSFRDFIEWVQIRLDIITMSDAHCFKVTDEQTKYTVENADTAIFRVDDTNYLISESTLTTIPDSEVNNLKYYRCAGMKDAHKFTDTVDAIYRINEKYHYIYREEVEDGTDKLCDTKVVCDTEYNTTTTVEIYNLEEDGIRNSYPNFLGDTNRYADETEQNVEYVYKSDTFEEHRQVNLFVTKV